MKLEMKFPYRNPKDSRRMVCGTRPYTSLNPRSRRVLDSVKKRVDGPVILCAPQTPLCKRFFIKIMNQTPLCNLNPVKYMNILQFRNENYNQPSFSISYFTYSALLESCSSIHLSSFCN